MAAITICSDFGAPQNKSLTLFLLFPHLFPMKWWDRMSWSSFSECWALSQIFHFPLSLSSRGFLVPLHFLPEGGVICISEVIDISPHLRFCVFLHSFIVRVSKGSISLYIYFISQNIKNSCCCLFKKNRYLTLGNIICFSFWPSTVTFTFILPGGFVSV